jgi:hypothetical protein
LQNPAERPASVPGMERSLAALALLAAALVPSAASAQTIVVVESPPPPPVIVVVEPPPPPEVVIVQPPAPPAPTSPPAPPPRFFVDLVGALAIEAGYDMAAGGGEARLGLAFDHGGILGALVVGTLADGFDDRSDVNLGIELERDFSPEDPILAFLLVGRLGTAFLLDERADLFDSGIRVSGQLGVGGRFTMGGDVSLLMDARALVRIRPDDPHGLRSDDVDAGVLFTFGLRLNV